MRKNVFKRIISVVLIISILFSFSFVFSAYAESKQGYITKDSIRVRKTPTATINTNILQYNGSNILLHTGHAVTILETVNSIDDTNNPKWCRIKFSYNGKSFEGYVAAQFVEEKTTTEQGGIMPQGVPDIYKPYIQALVNKHPNWSFVFYDTGIEWSSLLSENAQCYVGRSLIDKTLPLSYRSTQTGAYNWRTDTFYVQDSNRWYQANKETVSYFLDPRNFLNEKNVFMFESLSYNEKSHNISGIETILKNTFMSNEEISKNSNEKVSYATAFMDAAKVSGASPYHLAIRSIQEIGTNGSDSTSGTYGNYSGYYNFYNINASSGSDPVANGLKYASGQTASSSDKAKYDLPWDNQYKAIVGGAKWIADGYINNNQDTLYYQKFNVVNKVWTHQYMTNVMAPQTESERTYRSYSDLGILDIAYVFIIPYYRNMPSSACKLPEANNYSPNNWLSSLSIDGYSLDFDGSETGGYVLKVESDVSSVNISAKTVSSKATVSGTGKVSLQPGSNTVKVVVTAQNGDKRTYTIEVIRNTNNIIPLESISLNKTQISMFNGDTQKLSVSFNPSNTTDSKNVAWSSSDTSVATVKDGQITAIGKGTATITAKVGSHSASCKVTVTNNFVLGDIDADGVVTLSDAMMIFKYKSGEITLSGTSLKAADTDKNSRVELADALRIFKFKSGDINTL